MRWNSLGLGLGDLRPLMMTIPPPSQHYLTHTHIDLCCSLYRLNTLPNLQEYLEFLQSVTKMTKPLCGLCTPCVMLWTPLTKLASPTPGRAAMHTKQFSPHHSPRMAHRWNYPNYTSVKRFSQSKHIFFLKVFESIWRHLSLLLNPQTMIDRQRRIKEI